MGWNYSKPIIIKLSVMKISKKKKSETIFYAALFDLWCLGLVRFMAVRDMTQWFPEESLSQQILNHDRATTTTLGDNSIIKNWWNFCAHDWSISWNEQQALIRLQQMLIEKLALLLHTARTCCAEPHNCAFCCCTLPSLYLQPC